jgi:hypothetical protein
MTVKMRAPNIRMKQTSSSARQIILSTKCGNTGGGGGGGEDCIGGGGCISISMCISGADGGGEGSTSSYLAGEEFLSAAILASCAATRSFTVSSFMMTQLAASESLRYFLVPPGFFVK